MSAFYEEMREMAASLLEELGQPIEIWRPQTVADPIAGTVVETGELRQRLFGAVLPTSQGTIEAFDVRFLDGVRAETELRFAVISAEGASFIPGPNDRAHLEGVEWIVLGCTPLNPGGSTPVIFNVGFRRL